MRTFESLPLKTRWVMLVKFLKSPRTTPGISRAKLG